MRSIEELRSFLEKGKGRVDPIEPLAVTTPYRTPKVPMKLPLQPSPPPLSYSGLPDLTQPPVDPNWWLNWSLGFMFTIIVILGVAIAKGW